MTLVKTVNQGVVVVDLFALSSGEHRVRTIIKRGSHLNVTWRTATPEDMKLLDFTIEDDRQQGLF